MSRVGRLLFIGSTMAALLCLPVAAVSRGYTTDDDVALGMAVALRQENDRVVERANQENEGSIIGIAVSAEDSTVVVASKGQDVFVEATGVVAAYVSDFNGTVTKGTKLAISPLKGIMMTSNDTRLNVLATAEEDMANGTDQETQKVQTIEGEREVRIAKIKVNLDGRGAADAEDAPSSTLALRKIGRSIVGKEVSSIQVLAALLIFVIVLIAEGGIIYGAVSGALIAIGRNPLASRSIHQELLRVVLVAGAVLVIGIAAVYLILWI